MRENLGSGKLNENVPLMQQFRSNVANINRWVESIQKESSMPAMPRLPIKLNTSFFPSPNSQPHINLNLNLSVHPEYADILRQNRFNTIDFRSVEMNNEARHFNDSDFEMVDNEQFKGSSL